MKWNTRYRSCARRSSSQRETRAKAAPTSFGCGNGEICSAILESRRLYRRRVTLSRALQLLLAIAKTKKVRQIISFHDFKSTPSARILAAKARQARSHGADIFKVATRTDMPMELGRLLEFMTNSRLNLSLAVMGIGKLGSISRVLLTRAGSVLIYASLPRATSKAKCRWNNSARVGLRRQ